eukprot:UN09138
MSNRNMSRPTNHDILYSSPPDSSSPVIEQHPRSNRPISRPINNDILYSSPPDNPDILYSTSPSSPFIEQP